MIQTLNLESSSANKLLHKKNIEATILELSKLNVNQTTMAKIEGLNKKPEGILLYKKLLKKSKEFNRKMVINERPYLTKLSSGLVSKVEIIPNLSAREATTRISESLELLKVMKDAALNSNMKPYEKINFVEMISGINTLLNEFDIIEKTIENLSAQMLVIKTESEQIKQTQISRILQDSQASAKEFHFLLFSQLLFLATTLGLTLLIRKKTNSLIDENDRSLEDTLSKLLLDNDKTQLDRLTNPGIKRNIKRSLVEADGRHFINDVLAFAIPFPAFIVNQNKIIIWANKAMKERGSIDEELIKKQLLTSDMLFKILGLNSRERPDDLRTTSSLISGEEISFFKDPNYPGCYVAIVQEAKEEILAKNKSYTEIMPPPVPFEARPKYLGGPTDEISLSFCLSKNILILTRQLIDKGVKIDVKIDENILVNVAEEKFNEFLKTTLTGLTGDSLPSTSKVIRISGVREGAMYSLVIDHFNPVNQVLSEVLSHLSVEAGVNYQISGNRILMGMLTVSLGYQLERGRSMDL
jgi:hypothetical protein